MIDWDDDIPEEDGAEDPIIELTDIVNPDQDSAEPEPVIELTDIVTPGRGVSDTASVSETGMDSGVRNIDQSQIEAALERVIEKKFSDKIETILFEVMEKVIEKEIAEIRESLQRDLDQIGNV